MFKQKIIEKIKIAEEISLNSERFPKETYELILKFLLADNPSSAQNFYKKEISIMAKKKEPRVRNKGLSVKINDLILEGFFNDVKTSRDIIDKLRIMGYQMKDTSLPSYLLPKLRNGELIREDIKTATGKKYGYIRKIK
jgi:hypothetical protein